MTTMRFQYTQDADTVLRFLADPETLRKRSVAFGEQDVQIRVDGNTVSNTRKIGMDVPSFAKKILNPVNTVTDTRVWDPAARTCRHTVDIQGAPIKVAADARIVPNAGGCEFVLDFSVSCKIPLIGGQIEKHATGQTEDGMRREHDWNRANIGK